VTILISSGHHIKVEKDTPAEGKIIEMESSCCIHLRTRRVPGWKLGTISWADADFVNSLRLLGSRGKTSQNRIRNVLALYNMGKPKRKGSIFC